MPLNIRRDGAALAQTVLNSGRGGVYEKSLNSVAMFLLLRSGDEPLKQHANIETDHDVLIEIDKTYAYFASRIKQ